MELKPVIVNGLVGGAAAWIMATFVSWLHKRYTKDIPEEKKELTYEVEQYREFHVHADFEKALSTCLSALKLIKKSKLKNVDRINRVVTASVGVSFRSFGEKLNFYIKEVSPELMKLSIESKPWFWGTSVDYGKNYENIEIVCSHIRAELPTEDL